MLKEGRRISKRRKERVRFGGPSTKVGLRGGRKNFAVGDHVYVLFGEARQEIKKGVTSRKKRVHPEEWTPAPTNRLGRASTSSSHRFLPSDLRGEGFLLSQEVNVSERKVGFFGEGRIIRRGWTWLRPEKRGGGRRARHQLGRRIPFRRKGPDSVIMKTAPSLDIETSPKEIEVL